MKRLTIRLDRDLHEKLRRESFETKTSMNDIVIQSLQKRYEKITKEE